ncbi:hypothetical protein [Halorussus lipolyticus]|uniref:hypothetical protein n=1 Tax=Halorussus lipolyticus TaxID=3034024 RepID=UPI0023E8B1A0|nr:hypothetical protein [Halorussus sp. DT80]
MAKSVFESDNSLTYTEVHAAILGAVVGVLVGYGHGIGRTTAAVSLTVTFVGVALGIKYTGKIPAAQRTVRREPWYALAALLVGGTVGLVAV